MSKYDDYYHSRGDRRTMSNSHDDYRDNFDHGKSSRNNNDNSENPHETTSRRYERGGRFSARHGSSSRDNLLLDRTVDDDDERKAVFKQRPQRRRRRSSSSSRGRREYGENENDETAVAEAVRKRQQPSYYKEQKVVYTRDGRATIVETETWYRPHRHEVGREPEGDQVLPGLYPYDQRLERGSSSQYYRTRGDDEKRSRSRSPNRCKSSRDRKRSSSIDDRDRHGQKVVVVPSSSTSDYKRRKSEHTSTKQSSQPCSLPQLQDQHLLKPHQQQPDANRRADLRIVIGSPKLVEFNKKLTPDDIAIVPSLFGDEQNTTLYHDLKKEIEDILEKQGMKERLRCQNMWLSVDNPMQSEVFQTVVNRLCQYFGIDQGNSFRCNLLVRKGSRGEDYRNEVHKRVANITAGVSFGATREVSFLRSSENPEAATRVYVAQTNNSAFSIGHGVNLHWKHGINPIMVTPSSSTAASVEDDDDEDDALFTITVVVRGKSRFAVLDSEVPTRHPAAAPAPVASSSSLSQSLVSAPTDQSKLLTSSMKRDRSFDDDDRITTTRSFKECKREDGTTIDKVPVDCSASSSSTTAENHAARVKIFIPAWAMEHDPSKSKKGT